MTKNFISIEDFKLDEIEEILGEAEQLIPFAKAKITPPKEHPLHLDFGNHLAKVLIFMLEPSSRTAGSNDEAARLWGFARDKISGLEATSLMKKESLADAIRTHAGTQLADILVLRTKYEGSARFASEILEKTDFQVAVHNAGDGANRHPTQSLLNLLTIKQKIGRIHDFTIGFFGDLKYSRTLNSDLDTLRMLNERYGNIKIITVSSAENRIPSYRKAGLNIEEYDHLDALKKCNIISGTRIQEERYTDELEKSRVLGKYILDKAVLDQMAADVVIMHPGPRGPEIAPDISIDRRNVMWFQMFMGVVLRMTILRRSFLARHEPNLGFQNTCGRLEVLDEEPAEQRLRKREEQGKQDKYFRPIYKRGMILDHIEPGKGGFIKELIKKHAGLNGTGAIHLIEGIENRKDVIVIEGNFIPDWFFSPATFVSPTTTFNIIRDGLFKKVKIKTANTTMPKAFKCPNSVCITNADKEAQSRFTVGENEITCVCSYCNREFTQEEIIAATSK
ncbi:MAG TPA: aspartate carbamoyltransferase regulatory subunit [Candidatus Bipolaricaulota bacterium]|nr:aspartate carbamoyltransferase regulatory subunit [Candidatus Bipolaricaulota bacterium]